MISVITDYFTSMNPFVVASAYIPLLAGIVVWLSFYIKYDRTILKKLEWSFVRVFNSAQGFTKCRVENLKPMSEVALDLTTPQFEAAWRKMMLQAEERYTEEILPEGECFFREDALITVPSRRSSVKTIWNTILVLMVISILLPLIGTALLESSIYQSDITSGLLPAVLLLVIHLLFSALDSSAINKTMDAYHQFLYAFDTVVPTAAEMAGPALLLDATRKNQRSFENMTREMLESFAGSTNKISNAIDEFANGGVLPAIRETMQTLTVDFLVPSSREIRDRLDETLKTVIERQDTGMRELADSFGSKLVDTLESRVNMISEALGQYQSRMEEQNTLYQDRINYLNDLLSKNIQEMTTIMEKQNNSMERSEDILNQTSGLYRQEAENTTILNSNLSSLLQIIEQIREQNDKFAKDAVLYSEKSSQAQQQFSRMVNDVTGMMQEAMAGAGKEIACGINQAVGDNARAIADLTAQAQSLRNDYEIFFARSDESTKHTLDEMDYQIQGFITRMSEDIGTILNTAVEKNGYILDQYKDQTANILQSFDEQARSIGLYAKEINMDIAELSANLGASVSEFNEKMREGIQLAIGDFDSGLAELTNRIANTVESITDAVEALPASIKIANAGR